MQILLFYIKNHTIYETLTSTFEAIICFILISKKKWDYFCFFAISTNYG